MEEWTKAKVIGVLSGAFLALALDPPRTRLGFARRTGAAVVAGYIFGHIILTYMGWELTYENVVAAFCTSAFIAWAGMGRIKRFVESYRRDS